jgi:hypothetical protein
VKSIRNVKKGIEERQGIRSIGYELNGWLAHSNFHLNARHHWELDLVLAMSPSTLPVVGSSWIADWGHSLDTRSAVGIILQEFC